jgi:hypothetical protein
VFCSNWRYESLKHGHKSFYETGLYVNGKGGEEIAIKRRLRAFYLWAVYFKAKDNIG